MPTWRDELIASQSPIPLPKLPQQQVQPIPSNLAQPVSDINARNLSNLLGGGRSGGGQQSRRCA